MRQPSASLLAVRLPTLLALVFCGALPGPTHAAVVQIDVSALLDADVVVNDGNGGVLDPTQEPVDSGMTAAGNYAFPTQTVAVRLAVAPQTPDGLPDDAFFAASAFHPDVQLAWSNADDGLNARQIRFATGTFDVPVPPLSYSALHLFMTSGDGDSDVTAILHYSDATSSLPVFINVPDWFDDPPDDPVAYQLLDAIDRVQPGSGPGMLFHYEDRDDPAIFGYRLDPDPTKTLTSVTLERTDDLGVLNFFGATGVTPGPGGPDLYQSTARATILLPANVVARSVLTLLRWTPPVAPVLYYQVDDGSGNPPLLRAVKPSALRTVIEFTF